MKPRTVEQDRGFVTFRQLAAYLGFAGKRNAGAARKWVLRNRVPKTWRGGAWIIRLADVDRVLSGQRDVFTERVA
ncbi:hypothetical protein UFOVP998_54 [uncultured Caudovirales phage]|uniref:Helix-turn-helix domain containing protein n=1 Tax=uncultured Caudovirales phage TaxID=2100421 RepID=A0A6J5RNA2_9CAUD|nr:hypothetical protein UFOVP998_54 [uncultured Caudovirales phage]CAB4198920.1 hypothetical protein UFOVP1331_5 [uncultured Caudovirales phage]CAB4212519.1 hypothetical protein UFOVP1442_8 [uncultured Caudovirales phage]CAB5228082.1 hypothetical protein UFOVP1535_43 [uncultured Caudovirales phage]